MSMFVKFIDDEGEPVGVNVDHVVDLYRRSDELTALYLDVVTTDDDDGHLSQEHIVVRGTFDEILATLNAAAPQLHPSVLMPVSPAPWAPKNTTGGEA